MPTLIVETGAQVPNANTYVTLAESNTYFSDRGLADALWADLDDEVKQAALIRAVDYLQEYYRSRWAGTRVGSVQALDWPRAWVEIPDMPSGYGSCPAYIANNVIPVEVKRAQFMLALKTSDGTELNPDLSPPILKLREKVGPIETETQYAQGARQRNLYSAINGALRPYLQVGANQFAISRG